MDNYLHGVPYVDRNSRGFTFTIAQILSFCVDLISRLKFPRNI